MQIQRGNSYLHIDQGNRFVDLTVLYSLRRINEALKRERDSLFDLGIRVLMGLQEEEMKLPKRIQGEGFTMLGEDVSQSVRAILPCYGTLVYSIFPVGKAL